MIEDLADHAAVAAEEDFASEYADYVLIIKTHLILNKATS